MTTASLTFSSITLHGKFARGRPNLTLLRMPLVGLLCFHNALSFVWTRYLALLAYEFPLASFVEYSAANRNTGAQISTGHPDVPMLAMIAIHHFFNATLYNFRCVGNLTPVTREPLQITFSPFRENRLAVTVRVTDPSQPFTCRLAFLKEPRKDRQGNVRTICNLSIDLSEEVRHQITDR